MRRVTRASPASGSSEAPLVLSGEEDGVAPPPRIPPEEKERLRQMQKACTLRMYDHAVAYFMRTLQRTKTEGVGDCWLLSIMGGFEVKDPKLVKEVNDAQRHTICTARRLAIVEFAASSKKNRRSQWSRSGLSECNHVACRGHHLMSVEYGRWPSNPPSQAKPRVCTRVPKSGGGGVELSLFAARHSPYRGQPLAHTLLTGVDAELD